MDHNPTSPAQPPEHAYERSVLASLRRGAFLLETSIGLVILGAIALTVTGAILGPDLTASMSVTRYATGAALITLALSVVMLIGLRGWWRMLRAEQVGREAPAPDPARRSVLLFTVCAGAVVLLWEPVGQYATSYSDWSEARGYEDSALVSLGVILGAVFSLLSFVLMSVRYFVGIAFLGRLGARLGIDTHPGDARRLRTVTLVLIGLGVVSMGVIVVGLVVNGDDFSSMSESLSGLMIAGVIGWLICLLGSLIALCMYARLIDGVRTRCRQMLREHAPATAP